mmetsp:Transcript_19568/g.51879  ORF Transcript_19568/g.51879 Transcript_19568/m.51879 type:complete len:411 (-) Transcript_19568:88-1320(-)
MPDWWDPSESLAINAELRTVHDEQAADADFFATCDECMVALKEVCSAALGVQEFKVAPFDWTPDVRLERFGSTLQGVALNSSDLDVRMTFEQFCVHGQDRQMKYLKGVAAAPGERFEVVKLVLARLPVLRLRFEGRLDVDLTMGGGVQAGGGNTEELPFVDSCIEAVLSAAMDDGPRSFVRLVKAFSKAHGLVDAFNGYLNSASWAFLAIVFLQLERCLPPYNVVVAAEKRRTSNGKPEVPADGTSDPDAVNGEGASDAAVVAKGEGASVPPMTLWPTRLTVSLFSRFLAFVVRCGRYPHKVSMLEGCAWRTRGLSHSGGPAHPLVVEHPWRTDANIALCLKPATWKHTVETCDWARRTLRPPCPRSGPETAARHIFSARGAAGDVESKDPEEPEESEGGEPPIKRLRAE